MSRLWDIPAGRSYNAYYDKGECSDCLCVSDIFIHKSPRYNEIVGLCADCIDERKEAE